MFNQWTNIFFYLIIDCKNIIEYKNSITLRTKENIEWKWLDKLVSIMGHVFSSMDLKLGLGQQILRLPSNLIFIEVFNPSLLQTLQLPFSFELFNMK